MKSRKLLAAMAILAVAFVVLAAVPAAVTDSDAAAAADVNSTTGESYKYVVLEEVEGVKYYNTSIEAANEISGLVEVPGDGLTVIVEIQKGYEPAAAQGITVNGETVTGDYANGYKFAQGTDTAIVDVPDVTATKYTEDDIKSETVDGIYGEDHKVTLKTSASIITGKELDIAGKLVIPEGVKLTVVGTLTLQDTADVDIQGEIVVDGGTVTLYDADISGKLTVKSGTVDVYGAEVSGSIVSSGTIAVKDDTTMEISGTVTVDEDGIITTGAGTSAISVLDGGVLTIAGSAGVTVNNAGTVTFDSMENAAAANIVNLVADGAELIVKNYTMPQATAANTLTVTNGGAPLSYDKSEGTTAKVDSTKGTISIKPGFGSAGSGTISDITVVLNITETVSTDSATVGDITYASTLDVSGSITTSAVDSSNQTVKIEDGTKAAVTLTGAAGGAVGVSKSIVVGNDVVLANAGVLNVTGSITATAKAVSGTIAKAAASMTEATGPLAVTGEGVIALNGDLADETGVSAVKYTKSSVVYYTDIETAIDAADGTAVKALDVLGTTVSLDESKELKAGVTLSVADDMTLTIKEDAVLTILDGAKLTVGLSTSGIVEVEGTLKAENETADVTIGTGAEINADVYSTGKSPATWAKWTNIYTALAEADEGDTVTATDDITFDEDVEIPAEVTLAVPTGKSLTVNQKVTVTIKGTLYSADGLTTAATAGFAVKADSTHAGIVLVDGGYLIVKTSTGTAYSTSAGTSAFVVPGAYYKVNYDKAATPAVTTLDTALDNVDKVMGPSIGIYGALEQDVTFEAATICSGISISGSGNSLKGTVTLVDGSIAVDTSGAFEGTIVGGDAKVSYTGKALTASYDEENGLVLTGELAADDVLEIVSGTVTAGVIDGTALTTTAGSLTVTEDATLVAANLVSDNVITVEGILNVPEDGILDNDAATGVLNLKGSAVLNVDENANTAGVYTLNAGASRTAVFEDAAPTVIGELTLAAAGAIYKGVDATIDEDTLGTLKNLTYYVGTEAFLTVYAGASSGATVGDTGTGIEFIPNSDAYFTGDWYTDAALTDEATKTDAIVKPLTYTEVYADVDYDVYDVYIKAQAGIADVLLDGVFMTNDKQTFSLEGVAAGEHKITAKLTSGATATVVLKDSDGNKLAGNILTVSGGDHSTDEHVDVYAQLELTDSSEPSADMIVSVKSGDDGVLYVVIVAMDDGYIPAGTIDVTLNYTAQIGSKKVVMHDTVSVDIEGSDLGIYIAEIDMTESAHVAETTSVYATLTVGDDEFESDVTSYAYTEA